jgi:hypothetical protein
VGHGVDQWHYVVLLDVEVLDGTLEEFFFGRHSYYRISTLDWVRGISRDFHSSLSSWLIVEMASEIKRKRADRLGSLLFSALVF